MMTTHQYMGPGPEMDRSKVDAKKSISPANRYAEATDSPTVKMSRMSRLQQLHSRLMARQIVTTEDIHKEVAMLRPDYEPLSPTSLYVTYIRPLLQRGMMERIRRGLYLVGIPSERGLLLPAAFTMRHYVPNKMFIADRAVPYGVITYHTALEAYGVSQHMDWAYVHISTPHAHRFRPFEYLGYRYMCHELGSMKGVTVIPYFDRYLRITTPERTFVDCVDRPRLCGGWENVMKGIDGLIMDNPDHMLEIVRERNNQRLIRKVGFAIQAIKDGPFSILKLKDSAYVREELIKMVEGPPMPLELHPHPLSKTVKLDPVWRLYVSTDFYKDYQQGV